MPHTQAAQIGWAIYLAVIAVSLAVGRRVERITGLILLVELLAAPLLLQRHRTTLAYGLVGLDVLLLAYLTAATLYCDRRWLLWATAFQLLSVLTSLARAVDPSLERWSYFSTAILWGYLMLASLLVGTLQQGLSRLTSARGPAEPGLQG